jgi:hypothetical protein
MCNQYREIARLVQFLLLVGSIALLGSVMTRLQVQAQSSNIPAEADDVIPADALVTSAANVYLNYQGRILGPTMTPKADGVYAMTFRLWNVASGGAPEANLLWQEAQDVLVTAGAFSALLGSRSALNLAAFNGQALWLEVVAGAEVLSPRQPVAWTPYAIYANNSAALGGLAPTSFASATHAHAVKATCGFNLLVQRVTSPLTEPYAAASIDYDGATIAASPTVLDVTYGSTDGRYKVKLEDKYDARVFVSTITPLDTGKCNAVSWRTSTDNTYLYVQFFR